MYDLADIIEFPATPLQMHLMLLIETVAKCDGGLTHRGMNGYLYTQANMIIVDVDKVEVQHA